MVQAVSDCLVPSLLYGKTGFKSGLALEIWEREGFSVGIKELNLE